MKSKYQIAISLSIVLSLFFVLPWFSLIGADHIQWIIPKEQGGKRLLFLPLSVFVSAMLLFQYNLIWKERWFMLKSSWGRRVVNLFINMVLIFLSSVLLARFSAYFFEFKRTFLAFHFFRNILIASIAMLVAHVYDVMEQSKQDRIKLLLLSNIKVEAELAVLKSQVDPHFLFNSLNSLTGIIRQNQKEAIQFVNHLSETFRYVMEHRQNNVVSLKQELSFLESYLYMMRVRFGRSMDIKIEIPDSALNQRIPQFALQLLVENAIKHNRLSMQNPLWINITCTPNYIIVSNNLRPKNNLPRGYGIGLASLTKQYALLSKVVMEVIKTSEEFKVILPLL